LLYIAIIAIPLRIAKKPLAFALLNCQAKAPFIKYQV